MYKYEMTDAKDYREGLDESKPHGVILVKRELDGKEYAYGEFKDTTDMIEVSEEEKNQIEKSIQF